MTRGLQGPSTAPCPCAQAAPAGRQARLRPAAAKPRLHSPRSAPCPSENLLSPFPFLVCYVAQGQGRARGRRQQSILALRPATRAPTGAAAWMIRRWHAEGSLPEAFPEASASPAPGPSALAMGRRSSPCLAGHLDVPGQQLSAASDGEAPSLTGTTTLASSLQMAAFRVAPPTASPRDS